MDASFFLIAQQLVSAECLTTCRYFYSNVETELCYFLCSEHSISFPLIGIVLSSIHSALITVRAKWIGIIRLDLGSFRFKHIFIF